MLPRIQPPANEQPSQRPLAVPTPNPAQPTVSAIEDPRTANNVAPPPTDRKRRIAPGSKDSYTSSGSEGGIPLNADPAPPPAKKTKTNVSDKPLSLNPRLVARAPATHAARLKLLILLHKEYVRLHEYEGDEQLMLQYALDEEEMLATHRKSIYDQAMKKRIIKMSKTTPEEYRKSVEEGREKQRVKSGDGNMAPALSTGKTIQEELNALRHLINSPDMLRKYGYILDPPTEKEIKLSLDGLNSAGGWEQCDRCTTRFQVYQGRRESDGELASGGKCIFHWGRLIFLQRMPFPTESMIYANFR